METSEYLKLTSFGGEIHPQTRTVIHNVNKFLLKLKDPEKLKEVNFQQTNKLTAMICGIGERTVLRIANEFRKYGKPLIPSMNKTHPNPVTDLNPTQKSIIIDVLTQLTVNGRSPSVKKVIAGAQERMPAYKCSYTSMRQILEDLGCEFKKVRDRLKLCPESIKKLSSIQYASVNDTQLQEDVDELLKDVKLEKNTMKKVIKQLEPKYGPDIRKYKVQLAKIIKDYFYKKKECQIDNKESQDKEDIDDNKTTVQESEQMLLKFDEVLVKQEMVFIEETQDIIKPEEVMIKEEFTVEVVEEGSNSEIDYVPQAKVIKTQRLRRK